MLYSEEELKRLKAISASLGGLDENTSTSTKKRSTKKANTKEKDEDKAKEGKEPAKKGKKKVKSLVTAGLAGGAVVAALSGAPQLVNAVNSARSANDTNGVTATVDNDSQEKADEALKEMDVVIDANIEAIADKIAAYEDIQETISNLKKDVDDKGYHFTEEGKSWKYGVIKFDESLDNIDNYVEAKKQVLQDIIADNKITDDELATYNRMLEDENDEVRIRAVVDDKDNLYYTVQHAMNDGEGTNITKAQIEKIFAGKEGEVAPVYMIFEDEATLFEKLNKIEKDNSIKGVKLDAVVVEYDEETDYDDLGEFMNDSRHKLTTQGITLEGTKTKEYVKQVTPEAPVVPPVTPDEPPVIPDEPPVVPETGEEEEAKEPKKPTPNIEDEDEEEASEEEDKKAEEENFSETEEDFEEEDEAEEESFGDDEQSNPGEEFGDEEEAEEESFGDEEVGGEETFDDEEAWEEEFGD